MASAVDICNMALNLLGDEATVASVFPPEGSAQAHMAAASYPFALNSLLESYDWTFARRTCVCSPLDTDKLDGWPYGFVLPSDCLRVRSVRAINQQESYMKVGYDYGYWDGDSNDIEFALGVVDGQKVVYTSSQAPVVRYVTSQVNSDLFSSAFALALAYKVATLIVGKRIGGDEGVKMHENLSKGFEQELYRARAVDASQRQRAYRFVPKWIRGR